MKYAYFCSGFREKRGSPTGMKSHADYVRTRHPSARVTYTEWDDDPEEYAKDLAHRYVEGDTVTISVYSWGAGNWLHKFLWTLWSIDPSIKIDYVFFVDPVVRSRWPWMRWLALTDRGTIELPANIKEWDGVRQEMNEPNASAISIGNRFIPRVTFPKLNCEHSDIDNHKVVRSVVVDLSNKYL